MSRGSMHDIAQEGDAAAGSQSDSSAVVDSLSTQGARQIYERESHIVVDYSQLDDDYKDVRSVCLRSQADPVLHVGTFTHTHRHPFNGLFSGTTRVSWYQKAVSEW